MNFVKDSGCKCGEGVMMDSRKGSRIFKYGASVSVKAFDIATSDSLGRDADIGDHEVVGSKYNRAIGCR